MSTFCFLWRLWPRSVVVSPQSRCSVRTDTTRHLHDKHGGHYIRTCMKYSHILYCPLPQVTLVRFIPELTIDQSPGQIRSNPGSAVSFFVAAFWGQKITLVFGTQEMIFNLSGKANLLKSSCGVEALVNWNLSYLAFK